MTAYRHPALRRATSGFSLLEISVVILIIALLIGSVLIGSNMLRSAKLRAVSVDKERYVAAIGQFQQKYKALPGDMVNATEFWGAADADAETCEKLVTASTDRTTCNGNGDGHVFNNNAADYRLHERFRFWQHLSNAELIEGKFSGVNECESNVLSCYRAGVNSPTSEILGATWAFYDVGQEIVQPAFLYDSTLYRHAFYFGGERPTADMPFGRILSPKEAMSIDTKIDDGNPGLGKMTVLIPGDSISGYENDCATTDVADTATYKLNDGTVEVTTPQCILVFPMDF